MSYWIYQHLGNLSPQELNEDDLFRRVREAKDATRTLREFAHEADREVAGSRWSFHRDFGNVRLIMMDSRAGRVLDEDKRSMLDPEEWAWIEDKATGDFDHLLFGTSSRSSCPRACTTWKPGTRPSAGVPGVPRGEARRVHPAGPRPRALVRLPQLLRRSHKAPAGSRRGRALEQSSPASMVILSGDVHHGSGRDGPRRRCRERSLSGRSLSAEPARHTRLALRAGWTKTGERIGKTLARLARVEEPRVRWRLTHKEPWFENHVGTLELRGREATLRVEKTTRRTAGSHGCIRYSSAVWYEEASGPRT